MATEVSAYKCPECDKLHTTERNADRCHYEHLRQRCIDHDWNNGMSLASIAFLYGFHWDLSAKQRDITKDSCFTISHLQCCDHPAYRITRITGDGKFQVWGIGGWSGGYGSTVRLDCLAEPHPKEDLYKDPRAYKTTA